MSKGQVVELTVSLKYSGEEVDRHHVEQLLQNALEHCRQESMLSDPEWEATSCDSVCVKANAPRHYAEEIRE